MKITVVFLLLGTCLALSNAFIAGKKKPAVDENDAYCYGRMISLPIKRWHELQSCGACSYIEKSCKIRAIISDCFLILKMMTSDMGIGIKKLITMKTDFEIKVFFEHFENNNYEKFAQHMEKPNALNSFMQMMCIVVKGPMEDSGLDLGGVLSDILGDTLGDLCKIFPDLLGGILGSITGVIGGVVDTIGGVAKVGTDLVGGLLGGLGGLGGGRKG